MPRVKVSGGYATIDQFHGRWHWSAYGGQFSGDATSESAAKSAAAAAIRKGNRAASAENKRQAPIIAAKRDKLRTEQYAGKRCSLGYCSNAKMTPAHIASAKHRNALAVQRHQRGY